MNKNNRGSEEKLLSKNRVSCAHGFLSLCYSYQLEHVSQTLKVKVCKSSSNREWGTNFEDTLVAFKMASWVSVITFSEPKKVPAD